MKTPPAWAQMTHRSPNKAGALGARRKPRRGAGSTRCASTVQLTRRCHRRTRAASRGTFVPAKAQSRRISQCFGPSNHVTIYSARVMLITVCLLVAHGSLADGGWLAVRRSAATPAKEESIRLPQMESRERESPSGTKDQFTRMTE